MAKTPVLSDPQLQRADNPAGSEESDLVSSLIVERQQQHREGDLTGPERGTDVCSQHDVFADCVFDSMEEFSRDWPADSDRQVVEQPASPDRSELAASSTTAFSMLPVALVLFAQQLPAGFPLAAQQHWPAERSSLAHRQPEDGSPHS